MAKYLPLSICALISFCCTAQAQECPTTQLNDAVNAIKNASGCQAGIALYESCGNKASSYANLGALAEAAQTRCEKIFLGDLHGNHRRLYKSRQNSCFKQFVKHSDALFYKPQNHCGPYLAEEYAYRYVRAKEEVAKNPNPPL